MFVVIPNLNGEDHLETCLKSLDEQSFENFTIVVVDNASADSSKQIFNNFSKRKMIWLQQDRNRGFAGGVNIGIRYAVDHGAKFITLLNNDAAMAKDWIESQIKFLDQHPETGIVTGRFLKNTEPATIDSVGDQYSIWGAPFPEGRDQKNIDNYLENRRVLGATGGASVYRATMFQEIGLFDEDFFAYYEDVDISFRANLAGWLVMYNPSAIAHHEQGATSVKMPGFTTYQHFKNLPFLLIKNLPFGSFVRVMPRFVFAYTFSFVGHIARGEIAPTLKGVGMAIIYTPKKIWQRWQIQSSRKVESSEIWELLYKDMPPNARALRKLRSTLIFWSSYE